jgi:KUP system potassium uptake protein
MSEEARGSKYLLITSLGALGVVFGDIGTSPLYAFRESFHAAEGLPVNEETVLGILSLMFWSLVLVVTIKYLIFVMRADNHGEGGILALTALASDGLDKSRKKRRRTLILVGLFGTALLYGDGVITPAISVLSAVEGLEVIAPELEAYVPPIAAVIIVALFLIQRQGTSRVGALFGPVMIVWFAALSLLGIGQIINHPSVLAAISPTYAIAFIADFPRLAFLALGAVFLVVTGSEALYADMGHFGRRPIRLAWVVLVMPALLLNYFGQGALLVSDPAAISNPFYALAPGWAQIPMIVLATMATVIASQALISGAFSLTQQAIQMGYLPRMTVDHTSPREVGQVYLGAVNYLLMVTCVGVVFAFGSSSNLAAAYGVARVALQHPALAIDQELGEVPLDRLAAKQAGLFRLEVLVHRRRIVAIHVDFREQRKRHAVVDLAELRDLVLGPGFLRTELVARESQHFESLGVIFLVERFEALVLRREAALAGRVDHQKHLVVIPIELDRLAVNVVHGEIVDRGHGIVPGD